MSHAAEPQQKWIRLRLILLQELRDFLVANCPLHISAQQKASSFVLLAGFRD